MSYQLHLEFTNAAGQRSSVFMRDAQRWPLLMAAEVAAAALHAYTGQRKMTGPDAGVRLPEVRVTVEQVKPS